MALKPKARSEMDISDCSGKQQSDDGNGVRFEGKDVEVDEIIEWVNQLENEFQEEGEEVLCEASSSSSFGGSMCARDADDFGFRDGDEAQSMLSKDYPLPDGTEFLGLNKKKTKDQWRRLTKSLMWRCKWIELKVKEIQSQARGYDKEVKDYYLTKQFDLEKSKLEGFDEKSIPFREQTQGKDVFKRGRRKRVEETTDVAAYMSSHNLFSYADMRVPVNVKPQYLDLDFGTGRKATGKQDGTKDDCLLSELDCSDDFLAKLLCKIDEAQGKARGLKKRVDQLMLDSQIAHTSLSPQTTAPCHQDFTIQNGKQCALVKDPLTRQREASVRIGRKCISADHTEHPQTPRTQIGGQCLTNNSPISSKSLGLHPFLENLLMDDKEMNDDDMEADDEKLDLFRKLMDEITGVVSPEEAKAVEDPTPATKRRKTSH